MLKMVALFRFKPGVSREEGMRYYETRHVPLICELLPGFFLDYRRSYPEPGTMFFPAHMEGAPPPPPPFDVMTELWMESRETYKEMGAKMADPELGSRVAEDEAQFLDRSSMVMFLVEERRTSTTDLTAGAKRTPS